MTVSRYQPTKGPAAGGTKITVYGDHLDSGSEVGVTLAGIDCAIKQRYRLELMCMRVCGMCVHSLLYQSYMLWVKCRCPWSRSKHEYNHIMVISNM